jgi:putative ABC transport system permease protein
MFGLVFAYLWERRLTSALNVLLVAIATALLLILLLFSAQAGARFARDIEGIDLVVGAKGSPLQVILSSVFHIDQPTGNIPLESIDLLRRDPAVARVVPLALGDNFRGYRIVGTDHGFFDLYRAELTSGRLNEAAGEAVIGAEVARATGAGLGQQFYGSHGLGEAGAAHEHQAFIVVGVLAPTGRVADRLILTSLETVWDVHGIAHDHGEADHDAHGDAAHGDASHDDDVHAHDAENQHVQEGAAHGLQERGALRPEVTALLVTYRNASAAVRIPSVINRQTDMQAAAPAIETARLLSLFGASVAGARVFGWMMAAVAGLAIFVALFAAVQARAGDLALLRVMGAGRGFVFGAVLAEGVTIALLGLLLGLIIGYGLMALAVARFATLADLGFDPMLLHPGVVLIGLGVIAIGALSALAPALRVYGADIVKTLGRAT